jgi:hypothetical protein
MAGLYFGIASFLLGGAIITYIIRVIRNDGTPQPYFVPITMGIAFIVLGIALIIPYI